MIRYKQLLQRELINTGLAFLVPVLLLALNQRVSVHRLWISFLYSLIYTHSIGWLAFATIPKVWGAAENSRAWFQWLLRIVVVFAVALIGSMVAVLILVALGRVPLRDYWAEWSSSLRIAIVITVLASATISTYETMRARLDQREAERERALESRIHPHFLFNALNTISSLIPEDPARAERLVEQMAALLRFSLDANQSGLVPLARELKIVADYLDIEKARFGERLRYEIDVSSELNGAEVPPLSVQTLVENSVKHAIAPNRGGGDVHIRGNRENGLLQLEVSDDGPAFRLESAPAGHGLDNLKGRLATLFGERAALKVERLSGRNVVTLSVPQAGNGHASIPG